VCVTFQSMTDDTEAVLCTKCMYVFIFRSVTEATEKASLSLTDRCVHIL
jgi:hypothetical protein